MIDKFVHRNVDSAMPSTVRISTHGRDLLGQLAKQTGSKMTDILDAALENYRRQHFLQQANLAYAAQAEDPVALEDCHDEMKSLDGTLGDGLEKFPA